MRYLVLFAFCFSALLTTAQKKQITLEDIWTKGTFKIKSVPGFNAMKDGKRYTKLETEGDNQLIRMYDLASGNSKNTLFNNSIHTWNGEKITVENYSFSEDEKKLLLFTEGKNVYRRSAKYKVYVFETTTGKLELVNEDKILHTSFSPDGTRVALVKDNNVFMKDFSSGKITAVTTDGKWNEIINGNCDWVYEEEFEFTKAFEWSPDGKYIAYYRFDETKVPMYTMAVYDNLYPTQYSYKYPKAGEDNSLVSIHIFNTANETTVKADASGNPELYIPRIKWTRQAGKLCIYTLNRHQNILELYLSSASTGHSELIYREENKYYVEINDNLQFLPDQHSFIFNSEKSGYNHFYRWDWKNQKLTKLSSGKYDDDQLIGLDEKKKLLYYTSTEGAPLQRKLCAVNWKGDAKKILTPEKGTHAITPITGCQYFLDKYSRLNTVPVYYLIDANGKIVRTLESNTELKKTMSEYELGKLSIKRFPGAEAEIELNGWMITPPGFDPTKKYPVLMFQYSGPGSQQVADKFPVADFFWHQMLAEKGYVIVCADGTGTGFRGEKFKKKTYLQLGKLESDDQIAIANYLKSLSFVDGERIGIWGWSYGGFMSSTCIFKGHDVFKMAIAVAPVSNWRYYDNIYTERYMQTPKENTDGYDQNAPEKMAGQLKGKFLVIHGTGDDNVHFQNEVSLVDALIKANKDFDSEYYPNKAHGISGGNTRLHLYRRMTEYILKNL